MSPTIIEGAYFRDIQDQPKAVADTVAAFEERRDLRALGTLLADGQFRRVVLTGMGSSLHALHPLALQLVSARATPVLVETSELVHYAEGLLDGGSLIIAVSQSGRSAETLRLLDLAEGRATVVGVTNDPESPLARRPAHRLLLTAGAEATVSCKTYLATLTGLAWLGGHLSLADLPALRKQLGDAASTLTKWLATLKDRVNAMAADLEGVRDVFIVGRGPSLAAAHTAGLVIKESARVHAEGLSCASFRHGPLEMARPDVLVLVLEGAEPTSALNLKLVEDVRAAGGRAVLIGKSAPAGPFQIPKVPESVRPLFEILPAQVLSLALAARSGVEAGKFEKASKVTATE